MSKGEGIGEKIILKHGFKVDKETNYSDMGQSSYTLKDYSKDDKLFLTGGYWTWFLRNKHGDLLYKGWWETEQEFIDTLNSLQNGKQ